MFSNDLLTKPKNKGPIKPLKPMLVRESQTYMMVIQVVNTDICAKRNFSGIPLVWQFGFDVFILSSKETLTDTSSLWYSYLWENRGGGVEERNIEIQFSLDKTTTLTYMYMIKENKCSNDSHVICKCDDAWIEKKMSGFFFFKGGSKSLEMILQCIHQWP